jgi:hypothetical protein
MRLGCIVLLTLLASPTAFAECTTNWLGIGGSELATEVSNDERRELEQLLGMQLDDVACGRMRRLGASGFIVKHGFFVLTMDEALFVSDRKVREVLFRTHYRPVGTVYRIGHGSAVDHTLFVDITMGGERFRIELGCDASSAGASRTSSHAGSPPQRQGLRRPAVLSTRAIDSRAVCRSARVCIPLCRD